MLTRRLGMVLLMGLFATLLAGCGGGASFAKDMTAALDQVPGVVSTHTEHNNSAGMSTRINVRIKAASDADLHSVLERSLHAFADAAGSTKGTTSVAYYVFTDGAQDDGIRPDAVGLPITPTVDEIRRYAAAGS